MNRTNIEQKICFKIMELKKRKQYSDMAFIKKNKKKIKMLFLSNNYVQTIQGAKYLYIRMNNEWYELNSDTYFFKKNNFHVS